jgi:hypothetical protein
MSNLIQVIHPSYRFIKDGYDLALLKLSCNIPLQDSTRNPHIIPICLPSANSNPTGLEATVSGWGKLSVGGSLPTTLHQVNVPIISNSKCVAMFKKYGKNESIPDVSLCAGYENGGKDSCKVSYINN